MVSNAEIIKTAEIIGKAANAQRVILFGSHAGGTAGKDSDVDFMVIAESDLPRYKRSRNLYRLLRPYPFAMDLIVYTPREIDRGSASPFTFVSKVLKEGKTVYANAD